MGGKATRQPFPANPVTVAREKLSDINLPDFLFFLLTNEKTTANYTAGPWDQLRVKFYFKRLFGYYLLQVLRVSSMLNLSIDSNF